MNATAIVALLQLATSLLMGVQNNTHVTPAIAQQAITLSSQAIEQADQLKVFPTISFPMTKNNGMWPNITDLYNSAYLDTNGNYVAQGSSASLVPGYTSFGDMNGDGMDDAAAIIQRTDSAGNTTFALAAMLNQYGVMFNIADLSLGSNTLQINSHNVVSGGDIVLNMQNGATGAAQTSTYRLLGDQLIQL